jgi:hypothetical protein
MTDELDELDSFNDRVGGTSGSGRLSTGAPPAPLEEDSEVETRKSKDASMWAVQGVSYFPCDESVPALAPAQYEICYSPNSGYFFKKTNALFDGLIKLPDSASEEIIENIETFWTKEKHFRSFDFLWKRGILLWGPPGSGKTCTLQQISQNIIDQGGIAVYVNHPGHTAQGLAIMRRIEPKRPIVVMMEDLDALIQQHGEQEVLALLDGELQIDNVVFIATTNYPERLDKRIVNRPSRFDIVKLIDMPNPAARELYLTTKNKRLMEQDAEKELQHWISGSDGFSIAHLKELIVSVEVFEVSLDFALKRLQKMIGSTPKSTDASSTRSTGQYT